MASESLALTGTLRHSEAETLRADLRERMDRGPLRLDLSQVEGLDFGPLQVLLAAAVTATRRGLSFDLAAPPDGALARALATHALDGSLPVRPCQTLPETME